MRLLYGGVQLADVNGARFTWGRTLLRNRAQIGVGLQWRVDVEQAVVKVNDQADADAKIAAAEAALSVEDGDLVFQRDDAQPSAKSVLSAATLSGVRCVRGPVWSSRPGAQHQTWLEFSCAFEWETRFAAVFGGDPGVKAARCRELYLPAGHVSDSYCTPCVVLRREYTTPTWLGIGPGQDQRYFRQVFRANGWISPTVDGWYEDRRAVRKLRDVLVHGHIDPAGGLRAGRF